MKKIFSKNLIYTLLLFSTFLCLNGCQDNYSFHQSISDQGAAESLSDNPEDSTADTTLRISAAIIDNMAAVTDTGSLIVTEEMIDRGIMNPGNPYRLANVMERAAKGEDITIAYIGGSITDGDSASPKETACYAYLSTKWWEETFPDASITYINAGVGGTDSYYGVHRLRDDVLAYMPDLVITEFSVNDYRTWNKETYESLLRAILLSDNEPAVIALTLGTKQEYNYAAEHAQVAFKLGVPIINYASVISHSIADGSFTWETVGNADGVHPNNTGHALIARLLTQFYCNVLSEINTTEYPVYSVTDDTLTKSRYENADILYASDIAPVTNEGFFQTEFYSSHGSTQGWSTTDSGSIAFEVTGRTAGILFSKTTDGLSGQFDVFVDNVCVTTINADFSGGWGNCRDYIECFKNDESSTHLIELKPSAESTGTNFAICGICVGY